jgi:hypothetical protein
VKETWVTTEESVDEKEWVEVRCKEGWVKEELF